MEGYSDRKNRNSDSWNRRNGHPNLAVNRTYELTETKAPTGLCTDKTVHKVTLTTAQANKVVTVIIENTAQKGSIKIVKQDKDSKNV